MNEITTTLNIQTHGKFFYLWTSYQASYESKSPVDVVDQMRRDCLQQVSESKLSLSKLAASGKIKSMHEPLIFSELFFLYLEEYARLYKRSYPNDTEVDEILDQVKFDFGKDVSDLTNGRVTTDMGTLLLQFEKKVKLAELDQEEFSTSYRLLADLFKKPYIRVLQVVTLVQSKFQGKWKEHSEQEYPVSFPLCSLYQAYRLSLSRSLSTMIWFHQKIEEAIVRLKGLDNLGFRVYVNGFKKNFQSKPDSYGYQALMTYEEIKCWLHEQRSEQLSVIHQLMNCDLTSTADWSPLLDRFNKMVDDLHNRFPNQHSNLQINKDKKVFLEMAPSLEILQEIYIIDRLVLLSPNLRVVQNLLTPLIKMRQKLNAKFHGNSLAIKQYLETQLPAQYLKAPNPSKEQLNDDNRDLDDLLSFIEGEKKSSSPKKQKGKKAKKKKPRKKAPNKTISSSSKVQIPSNPPLSKLTEQLPTMEANNNYQHLQKRVAAAILNHQDTIDERKSFINVAWHLNQLEIFHRTSLETNSPLEYLDAVISCASHAAWTLEQTYRALHSPAPLTNHNLKLLSQDLYKKDYPDIVKKLYLANHWCRFYLEEMNEWHNFTMITQGKTPELLELLVQLNENPEGLSSEDVKKEISHIVSDTHKLLLQLLPKEEGNMAHAEVMIPEEKREGLNKKLYQELDSLLSEYETVLLSSISHANENPSAILKTKQNLNSVQSLRIALQRLQAAKSYREYSANALRSIQMLQDLIAEHLAIIQLRHVGKAPLHHEVQDLAMEIGITEDSGILAEFSKLSGKLRYPTQYQSEAEGAQLVDALAALAFRPELDLGFKFTGKGSSPYGDLWNLPSKELSITDIHERLHIFLTKGLNFLNKRLANLR